jgi:dihydrofolate reductase
MRKIAAGLFISLDGVVESPEKWTGPYFNDQVGQAVGALMAPNDAMLLGRVTYEGFAAAFGGQSGGMADQMNNTPKYVVSGTLASADWENSTLISQNVAEEIRALKELPGMNIGMSGSSTLVGWLLREGLLDQLDLLVFPVVLGTGKRLFSEPGNQIPLALTGSQAFSTGVMHLSYEPAQLRTPRTVPGKPRDIPARPLLAWRP